MRAHLSAKITMFFLIASVILILIALFLNAFSLPFVSYPRTEAVSASGEQKYKTVIIDAGHGGEDGGAVSSDGLIEKNINLEIATVLRDMLRAIGIEVIMTREDDRLLYDRNTDYKGKKKKLDLAARLSVAESTPDAIFVSIHMNSYPDPKYHGMQVFYSPNHSDSALLADIMRRTNLEQLQPENKRQTKMATSAINLLYNAKCPAVLVECGFLSSTADAELFRDDGYKQKVAFVLFCSITEFLIGQDTDNS